LYMECKNLNFVAYFPSLKGKIVSFWDHHTVWVWVCVCVCVSTSSKSWIHWPIYTKLGMNVMPLEATPMPYFLTCHSVITRQAHNVSGSDTSASYLSALKLCVINFIYGHNFIEVIFLHNIK
jgi:hypothetical protein